MKRKILGVLCLMLALLPCLTLVACKKAPTTLEGEFHATSISITAEDETTTLTRAEYEALLEKSDLTPEEEMQLFMTSSFFDLKFVFSADNTFIQESAEDEEMSVAGTYTLNGEDLSMTLEDETVNAKYKDGKITLTINPEEGYVIEVVLEK